MITYDSQIKLRASADIANNSIGPMLSHYIGQTYGWGDLTTNSSGTRAIGSISNDYTTFGDFFTSYHSYGSNFRGGTYTYGPNGTGKWYQVSNFTNWKGTHYGDRTSQYNSQSVSSPVYQNIDHSLSFDEIDNKFCSLSSNKIKILNRSELYQALLDSCVNFHLGPSNNAGIYYMTNTLSDLSTDNGKVYTKISDINMQDQTVQIYKCSNTKPVLSPADRLFKYTGMKLSAVTDSELEILSHLLRLRMSETSKGLYYLSNELPSNTKTLNSITDVKDIHTKSNSYGGSSFSYVAYNTYHIWWATNHRDLRYRVYTTWVTVNHSYSSQSAGKSFNFSISI